MSLGYPQQPLKTFLTWHRKRSRKWKYRNSQCNVGFPLTLPKATGFSKPLVSNWDLRWGPMRCEAIWYLPPNNEWAGCFSGIRGIACDQKTSGDFCYRLEKIIHPHPKKEGPVQSTPVQSSPVQSPVLVFQLAVLANDASTSWNSMPDVSSYSRTASCSRCFDSMRDNGNWGRRGRNWKRRGRIIINCVAIFYEEGMEGENFRRAVRFNNRLLHWTWTLYETIPQFQKEHLFRVPQLAQGRPK